MKKITKSHFHHNMQCNSHHKSIEKFDFRITTVADPRGEIFYPLLEIYGLRHAHIDNIFHLLLHPH